MITDAAFDHLLAIYEHDRILWAAAHVHQRSNGLIGLRMLAVAHDIDPDA